MFPLLLYLFCLTFGLDPDVGLNMEEIVRSKGYPIQRHNIQTQDGYILGVFRIPSGRNKTTSAIANKPAVLLQHGLLDSSYTFVNNFPDQSLGFLLADAGYDVWFGNNRGNVYSDRHVKYPNSSPEFWNFTFDKMARYDLPAMIEYIIRTTGRKTISYVGHSQVNSGKMKKTKILFRERLKDSLDLVKTRQCHQW